MSNKFRKSWTMFVDFNMDHLFYQYLSLYISLSLNLRNHKNSFLSIPSFEACNMSALGDFWKSNFREYGKKVPCLQPWSCVKLSFKLEKKNFHNSENLCCQLWKSRFGTLRALLVLKKRWLIWRHGSNYSILNCNNKLISASRKFKWYCTHV